MIGTVPGTVITATPEPVPAWTALLELENGKCSMSQISIDLNVDVPMRDGAILRADVYRPADAGSYPVLIQRTPYDRKGPLSAFLMFDTMIAVKRGYIVVQQDTRGRFDSDGEWLPWAYEQQDGYDTVVWASHLPGSNGRVGMVGGSYTGQTQWAAAIAAPPCLAAIAPQITWSDPEDGLMFRGGAIELGLNGWWTLAQGFTQLPKIIGDPNALCAAMVKTIEDFDSLSVKGYWELPAAPLPALTRVGQPDLGVHRALQDPATTKECRVAGNHDRVSVPTLNIGGWYDVFQQGTLDNYIAMRARGLPAQLVMSPRTHLSPYTFSSGQVGDLNFGLASEAAPGANTMTDFQLDWFDNYLRDGDAPSAPSAPVKIFVMGINQWREEEDWPIQRAVSTPLYLHAGGRLSFDPPSDEESHTHFTYDPTDPVPTCGGSLMLTSQFPAGPKDQAMVERREDVLVFSTPVLTDDVEITGRLTAQLFAATDGTTTDWVVKLCDVDENGVSHNIADGITRVKTVPGRVDGTKIDLWSTSIVIKAGHRIRIQISSSNFPRWDRNPNIDGEVTDASQFRIAHQTIRHDARHPSHLLLPVVP